MESYTLNSKYNPKTNAWVITIKSADAQLSVSYPERLYNARPYDCIANLKERFSYVLGVRVKSLSTEEYYRPFEG